MCAHSKAAVPDLSEIPKPSKSLRIRVTGWWLATQVKHQNLIQGALVASGSIAIYLQGESLRHSLDLPAMDLLLALTGFVTSVLLSVYVMLRPWLGSQHLDVYCVAHEEHTPPESWRVSHDDLLSSLKHQDVFTDESMDFMARILKQSGTNPEKSAAFPKSFMQSMKDNVPFVATSAHTRQESEEVIKPVVRELLRRTGVNPKSIDYVIVNCTMYNPVPSHCAMIVNEFGMRTDVATYNLAGMGCSAGVISIDLAKRLLSATPGRALVVSTEILTQCIYKGNDREPLVGNTLFRCGGAAALLSSLPGDAHLAKYKLLHCVRSQVVDPESYTAIYEMDDSSGKLITLSLKKAIIPVAGRAIKQNLTRLGPLVLSYREQAKVAWSMLMRKVYGKSVSIYVPDFRRGIDHWCVHAGGRAVLDAVQKNMHLSDFDIQPSRQVLFHRGNTSSSSIWYELAWAERDGRVQKGDRVLQMAFGSGFKCNTAVWLSLADKNGFRK